MFFTRYYNKKLYLQLPLFYLTLYVAELKILKKSQSKKKEITVNSDLISMTYEVCLYKNDETIYTFEN